MPEKRKGKQLDTLEQEMMQWEFDEMTDAELDHMLAQWAADDIEVTIPEGFHEKVMARVRAEQQAEQQAERDAQRKKGAIVSVAERFVNQKAWMSTVAAAALLICCLPILHGQQKADVNLADMQIPQMQDRMAAQSDTESDAAGANQAHNIMMASLAEEDTLATEYSVARSTTDEMKQADSADGIVAYDQTLTPEEQLSQLQEALEDVQAQLAALADTEANRSQRDALLAEEERLRHEIQQLEQQIADADVIVE